MLQMNKINNNLGLIIKHFKFRKIILIILYYILNTLTDKIFYKFNSFKLIFILEINYC